jgi:hypothetical protein
MATWPSLTTMSRQQWIKAATPSGPSRALTTKATDWENVLSSLSRHHSLLHHRTPPRGLANLIARDKAVSTLWNCTRKTT